MFFDFYPQTNMQEFNLDWIIRMIKKLHGEMNEFTALNKITFDGEWDITKQYPAWCIVNTNGGQQGYISIRPVPAGVVITNTDYWASVVDYTATIADLQNRVAALESEMTRNYYSVKTQADLVAGDFKENDRVYVLGRMAASDGGNGVFVVEATPGDFYLTLNNGLYANLIFKDVINMITIGATPDDNTADNALVLKNAIDLLPNGGTVYFPRGTYRFAQDCRGIRTDHLTFTGNEATIFIDYDQNSGSDSYPLFFVYSDDVTFDGLTIECDPSVPRSVGIHGILAQDTASNLTIKNCTFKDISGAAVYLASNVNHALVTDNIINGTKADGILISDGSTDIIVTNNRISGTGDDCISCVWNDGYPTPVNKVVISDNICTGGAGHGVNVCHAENVLIANNSIKECESGGISVYRWMTNPVYAKNIMIVGNNITDVEKNGILIDGCDNSVIEGNHIITPELVGIRLGNYNSLTIRSNTIDGAPYGIAIDNQNIFADCNYLSILYNDIIDFAGNAVALAPMAGTVVNHSIVAGNITKTTATVYAAYNLDGLTGIDVMNNITKNGIIVVTNCTGDTLVNNN